MSDFPESLREARALDAQQHYADQARIAELERRLERIVEWAQIVAERHGNVVGSDQAYPELLYVRDVVGAIDRIARDCEEEDAEEETKT